MSNTQTPRLPKRTTVLECRKCGNTGYYEDIRDDYSADEPDFEFGTCGECDPPSSDEDENDPIHKCPHTSSSKVLSEARYCPTNYELRDKIQDIYRKKVGRYFGKLIEMLDEFDEINKEYINFGISDISERATIGIERTISLYFYGCS